MNRRTFLTATVGGSALAALLAACGSRPTTSPPTTASPTTTVAGVPIPHPVGADDVVLRLSSEGGLIAPGFLFVTVPMLLISGDGRVFEPGVQTAQYPGPLLPPILLRSITEAGTQRVLRLLQQHQMLAPPPDYAFPPGRAVMDAPDTVLLVHANGTTYEHRAPALGLDVGSGESSTPARDNFAAVVALLGRLVDVAGAGELGQQQPLQPAEVRLQASVVDPSRFTNPSPTIVPWPVSSGVVLKDAGDCARVSMAALGATFDGATTLTFFSERDGAEPVVYRLAVIAVLPGDHRC